jgi:hypothetical protein
MAILAMTERGRDTRSNSFAMATLAITPSRAGRPCHCTQHRYRSRVLSCSEKTPIFRQAQDSRRNFGAFSCFGVSRSDMSD